MGKTLAKPRLLKMGTVAFYRDFLSYQFPMNKLLPLDIYFKN